MNRFCILIIQEFESSVQGKSNEFNFVLTVVRKNTFVLQNG